MPYLIDGHNLIGQLPDISLEDPNDEALLVQKLAGFAARTSKRCVVVFDHGLPGGYSSMSTRQVRVIFASAQHSTADHIMIARIRRERDPGGWTVVSSDHAVREAARRRRMRTVTAIEFAQELSSSSVRPGVDVDEDVHLSPEEVEAWLAIFGGEEE